MFPLPSCCRPVNLGTVSVMSEISDRYRKVAAGFTDRVEAVSADGWDRPSPCAGWSARDVVRHVGESSGRFLGRVDVRLPEIPSVDDDPVASWRAARDAVLAALEDPDVATLAYDSPMGQTTLERTIGMFGVGDVLVHTWDLARATGLDERLDPDEVRRLFEVMEPNDEMMRQGDAFGPRVPVGDDADDQTKLLAFTGRSV
jgi:uncharacterized protein (TIGR03086 family)